DYTNIRLEQFLICFDKWREIRRGYLLFAFDKKLHIDRSAAVSFQIRLQRLYMDKQLSFVISRPPGEDLSVFLDRFERRIGPAILDCSGHHIVVAIHQNRGFIRPCSGPGGVHDGVTGCGHDLGALKSHGMQLSGEPFCRFSHVFSMSRISTETRNAQKLMKFVSKSLCMIAGIFSCLLARPFHVSSTSRSVEAFL